MGNYRLYLFIGSINEEEMILKIFLKSKGNDQIFFNDVLLSSASRFHSDCHSNKKRMK